MAKKLFTMIAVTAFLPALSMAASYGGGAGTDFTYTNAADIHGRFGMPIPAGNDIFFPFATFSASANSANPTDLDSDTLTMDVQANPGLQIDSVQFRLLGTRTITGTAGANTVQSHGELTVTGQAGDTFSGFDSYMFFDDQPVVGASWTDEVIVTVPLGTQVTEINLVITQGLMAVATDGDALITATFELPTTILVSVIPEPSSLALLGLGALGLTHRRRFRE